jgi:acetylglutamate kinase
LPAAADTVLTFLESVGRRSEAELYLRQFLQLKKESFAVVAPGAPVVRYALGSLVEEVRFLADLGLFAPLLLGLFDTAGAVQSAERLCKRLPSVGLEPCPHDAAHPELIEHMRDQLRAERIPIVHFAPREGEDSAARFARLGQICRALETQKLVLVRRRGGLGPQSERPIEFAPGHVLTARSGGISVINLRTDRAPLLASKKLRKDDAELLERIAELLAADAQGAAPRLVSVTSPLNLLKELFTVKGAGTLVKRGTAIEQHGSYADIDRSRLKLLLETSFGRALDARFFDEPPLALYLESDYRGAAILQPSAHGAFLTKFAVEPVAQGEGIGQDLWQALIRDQPAVFWRARPDNPIVSWYLTLADGMVRLDGWVVFWRGIEPARIVELVAEAAAKRVDFESSGGEAGAAP